MTSKLSVLAASVVVVAGCTPKTAEPPPSQFDTGYPVLEMMVHAVQPAAEKFWNGAGTISDSSGTRSLRPTTEEGWKSVEDGAIMTVELSNALLLPGRVREPEADWRKHVAGVVAIAKEAQMGAQTQADEDTLLDIGGRLYEACQACHEQFNPAYAPPATGAAATDAPAK